MIAIILISKQGQLDRFSYKDCQQEYSVTNKSNIQEWKKKKSHDFPRLFGKFPMIPMTLWTPPGLGYEINTFSCENTITLVEFQMSV